MNSPTISAVILTKNEERNLPLCLKHLKWIDDLIVVDSGSTDSTLDIAKKFGARIFVNIPKKFYIADQRNWALDNTEIKTNWILFIDADEIITETLKNEILKTILKAPPEITAFQLCFKFIFLGRWLKHCFNFPSWHDRLIRFGKARFKGKVWESFDTKGRIERIYEPYLHHGFNNGINVWIDKHQRYAEWKAQEILNQSNLTWQNLLKGIFSKDRRRRYRALEKLGGKLGRVSPFFRFFYYYFIRKGFLDGRAGFIYCQMMAMFQFMIYLHLLEKQQRKKGSPV